MQPAPGPGVLSFTEALGDSGRFGQVQITRQGKGFELRHMEDAERTAASLRRVSVGDLRQVGSETAAGAFRPLRSAPNLQTGWRCEAPDVGSLETALDHLYPAGLSDWHSRNDPAQATCYRDFTSRQTGMYRLTAKLDEEQAPAVFDACCDDRFCLKERRWTYDSVATSPAERSVPPCLEPCPVLLEFARKAVRINQGPSAPVALSVTELESLIAVLDSAWSDPPDREADFAEPRNLRRLALLKPRLTGALEHLRKEPDQ